MNWNRTKASDFFCFDEGNPSGSEAAPAAAQPASPAPSGGAPAEPAQAEPSTSPAGEASPAQAEASGPFAGLGVDLDDLDSVILPGEGGTAPPAPAPQAKPVPAQQPQAAQPPAAPPTPAAPTPASPGPTPTSDASPGARLEETIAGFKTNQAQLSAWAGQNLFKLSDDDAAALATNAEEVIPRLMGQVYTQAMAAAANLIRNFVPSLIEHSIETTGVAKARATEAINEFYSSHKDLNAKEHGDAVTQWAKAFRAANPKATRQQAIDYVGRAVRIQFGMPMPGAPAQSAARPAPFAPARPGGRQPQAPAEHDPYAGMGMDDIE